jgi:uncharacterized iron-regulated membrane protein
MGKHQQQASRIRTYRKIHKYLGVGLALAFLFMAVSGILLAWKKDVDALQPPSQKGASTSLHEWTSMAVIAENAQAALKNARGDEQSLEINKMDARPDKGMVKVLFENGFWEVQVDATTGEVLSVARRHSDWIEKVHDGSIISDWFKLSYSSLSGLGLLLLALSGFWLWYGPKKLRAAKHKKPAKAAREKVLH